MDDEFSQLPPGDIDFDADQRIAMDDDETALALSEVHRFSPDRRAWRDDVDEAPLGRPVYARQVQAMRILMAMRDEDGWCLITRDGECRAIDDIASWAPVSAALA